MLARINLEKILFLDIETVAQHPDFSQLDDDFKAHWEKKAKCIGKDDETPVDVYKRAGIYSEFGKIVCISVGFIKIENGAKTLRLKSYANDDESVLINDFFELLNNHYNHKDALLCAHNGKEFDFPYIARRMIINDIELPYKLNLFGKKPWEVPHLDTLELWKFGDYKTYTSLKLLTNVLGIPSPKDDIDGSEVYHVYYKENEIDRIIVYCEKDTIAVAQIFLRLRGDALLTDDEIIHI